MAEEIQNNNKNLDPGLRRDDGGEDELKEKLAAAEKQRDEYLDGWKRAKADFLNYKKDELKHLEDMARYGNEEIMKDLISVLDNFDLGLRALEKNGAVEKGVYMIRAQIEDVLKRRGLVRVSVKLGDEFDPSIAEAVAMAESDKPPGTVIEEIEPGYRLYDKIIRPARVKIAKSK
ncbi:MAG: nucleotide exchange factor GrpE [Candidatus Liptonbacteria bacterium]|nr:nucleotide exchange factor GrpE [Candidatus Liptonbacteria bacterium]